MKYSPDFCLFFAPTINSYKRYQPEAGRLRAWPGPWIIARSDFAIVGEGQSFRIENRMPGADANPYLAFSAMLAAGMAGVEGTSRGGREYIGNAYPYLKLAGLPSSLRDADGSVREIRPRQLPSVMK